MRLLDAFYDVKSLTPPPPDTIFQMPAPASLSVYEFVLVNAPQKRVHPEGECNPKVLEQLKNVEQKQEKNDVDPRWATLKDINTEK